MNCWFYLALIFLSPPLSVAGENSKNSIKDTSCQVAYVKFTDKLTSEKTKYLTVLSDEAISSLRKSIRDHRDRLRYFITTKIRKETYPVVALDDATPLKAWIFSKSCKGSEIPKNPPFAIEEVQAEIDQLVGSVKKFSEQFYSKVDEIAELSARLEYIQNNKSALLEEINRTDGYANIPLIKSNKNGATTVVLDNDYFGSKDELERYIRDLRSKIKSYTAEKRFYGMNGFEQMLFEQQVNIKRLETYKREITRELSNMKDKPIAPKLSKTVDGLNSVFTNSASQEVKKEYASPNWVKNRLGWTQLGAELKIAFVSPATKIKDRFLNEKTMDYLASMAQNDRTRIGYSSMASGTSVIQRTRWGRVLAPTVTASGALTYGVGHVTSAMGFDKAEKEACAFLESDEDTYRCTLEFIEAKHWIRSAAGDLTGRNLLDIENDPELQAEVLGVYDEIMKIRSEWLSNNKFKPSLKKIDDWVKKKRGDVISELANP